MSEEEREEEAALASSRKAWASEGRVKVRKMGKKMKPIDGFEEHKTLSDKTVTVNSCVTLWNTSTAVATSTARTIRTSYTLSQLSHPHSAITTQMSQHHHQSGNCRKTPETSPRNWTSGDCETGLSSLRQTILSSHPAPLPPPQSIPDFPSTNLTLNPSPTIQRADTPAKQLDI